MTAHKPSHLVPKLRFPEFWDAPAWNLLTLSSTSDVNPTNDGLPEMFIYINLESVKSGELIEREKITRDTAPSRAQRLLTCKDIIYQTVRPYQRNNLFFDIDDGYEYVASTGYAQLRAYECPEFLYQLLHTDSFVNNVLARCTGSNYPAINPLVLASIKVTVPTLAEQQKIADCLGTLDDLIAAETRKLEALRQHKQGLMQQLFPQPGETVPRLRFPEFRDAEGWEPRNLGDIADFFKGKGLPKSMLLADGTNHCIHYGELFTTYAEVIRTINSRTDPDGKLFLSIEDDVLMPTSDVTPNGLAKACCVKLRNVIIGGDVLVIRPDQQKVRGEFLARYIRHLKRKILQLVTGSTVYHLHAASLEKLDLYVPKPLEQQKIADCLSSLDDLITAKDHKIETLRQHKQGMMQQLFPSLVRWKANKSFSDAK